MSRGRSLRTHLLALYVLLALLSGVVTPGLCVWLTLSGFQRYQIQRRQASLDSLRDSLMSIYAEEGRWDRRRVMDILRPSPQWMGMDIVLRNAEGSTLFTVPPPRPGRGGQEFKPPSGAVERIHMDLTLMDGRTAGSLDVSHRLPPTRFEREFLAYLTRYVLAGAAAMIALACGLGFVVAGGLSRPVVKAVERTDRIRRGEYDLDPVRPTGIREMDALSRGVEELGRSLAGQERLRRRLMVDIAHELRTPLTAARTQIEAMADGVLEASPERLAICVSEMERLGGLIEAVESLTRLEGEALAVRPEPTDMAVFLSSVLDAFAPLFDRGGVALRRELAPDVTAAIDPERFRHVVDNLLSNALRYTPQGGSVTLRLLAREGGAVVEVEDTGPGISEADLPHIFERFYRTDASRARVSGGRGVGLAIARAAVEAHDGSISAASQPGRGSRFTVTLPPA